MKLRQTFITLSACGALALAVGACTHSDDSGVSTDELDAANERADQAEADRDAAEDRAEDAEADKKKAEEERDAANQKVEDIEADQSSRETSELYENLGRHFANANGSEAPLLNEAAISITASGAPKLNTITLSKKDAMYSGTRGNDKYSATVLNTQGPGDSVGFFAKHGSMFRLPASTRPILDNIDTDTNNDGSADGARFLAEIKGFPTAGENPHDAGEEVSGTFDGVPGTYTCISDACTSQANDDKSIQLAGNWQFAPDSASATVSSPDTSYLSFGWWLRQDTSADRDSASAYVFVDDSEMHDATFNETIQGEATYTGEAVGKYAIYSALLGGDQNEAGHFTADATLTASFGDATADAASGRNSTTTTWGGVTGTIDNFMADGEEKAWTVSLNLWPDDSGLTDSSSFDADRDGEDNILDDRTFSGPTAWAIDGVRGSGSGHYRGTFYNSESGGTALSAPDEMGGTFDAEFEASTARMIGAFAATRDDN